MRPGYVRGLSRFHYGVALPIISRYLDNDIKLVHAPDLRSIARAESLLFLRLFAQFES